MKKKGSNRALLIFVAVLVCYSGTCFERDTRVSISQIQNPPTFVLSGNGFLQEFIIFGPFSNLEEMHQPATNGEGRIAWKLYVKGHTRVYDLSPITYGNIPVWASQAIPERGSPKPLEEGKIYSVGGSLVGANFRQLCFTVKNGEAVKVDCEDR